MVDGTLKGENIKRFSIFDRQTSIFGITPYGQEGLDGRSKVLNGMMIILLDLKLEPLKLIKVNKDKKQESLYQFPHATLQQLCIH